MFWIILLLHTMLLKISLKFDDFISRRLVPFFNINNIPSLFYFFYYLFPVKEMVKRPYETRSDSFYFVNNELVMHNKADYAYDGWMEVIVGGGWSSLPHYTIYFEYVVPKTSEHFERWVLLLFFWLFLFFAHKESVDSRDFSPTLQFNSIVQFMNQFFYQGVS